MPKIKELIEHLEAWAPPAFQEAYDNSRLICGNASMEVEGVLCTLDCTEAVVDEALTKNCNVIVAHHPILFKALKSLTGKNYVERTLIKAIKNDVSIYAAHTNLDHVATGVNKKMAEKMGLHNPRILAPKTGLLEKLITFIPVQHTEELLQALYAAGGGSIGNYEGCSFRVTGTGTFTHNEAAQPSIGQKHIQEEVQEDRIELIYPAHRRAAIEATLKKSHPYEEVAYYQQALLNTWQDVGAGMIGVLPDAMKAEDFLHHLKKQFSTGVIRHTPFDRPIKKVAICGGAGIFLLKEALRQGADAFVTGDIKYHEFFDAEGRLLLADVGHYESEFYTIELIHEHIRRKFRNIATYFTDISTNPINYFH
jgi:dinuclear metal center YbgI/SA1388 family protein